MPVNIDDLISPFESQASLLIKVSQIPGSETVQQIISNHDLKS